MYSISISTAYFSSIFLSLLLFEGICLLGDKTLIFVFFWLLFQDQFSIDNEFITTLLKFVCSLSLFSALHTRNWITRWFSILYYKVCVQLKKTIIIQKEISIFRNISFRKLFLLIINWRFQNRCWTTINKLCQF